LKIYKDFVGDNPRLPVFDLPPERDKLCHPCPGFSYWAHAYQYRFTIAKSPEIVLMNNSFMVDECVLIFSLI
jgi:hypothetical protein